MKKLQNNFTTPEQSKRLLELGVPANSADCYNVLTHIGKIPDGKTYKNIWQMSVLRKKNGSHIEMYPCWSVGRLIEIFRICTTIDVTLHIKSGYDENLVGGMIINLENMIDNEELDFSKLEE